MNPRFTAGSGSGPGCFRPWRIFIPWPITLQMLVPMLENAGAGVFLPRERDWQVHEVIVDNDGSSGKKHFCFS